MKTIEIYREALSKGMSGKEAAYEYGVKYHTLWTAGRRAGLPPLVRDNRRTYMYRSMGAEQLRNTYETLHQELQIVKKVAFEKGVQVWMADTIR